MITKVIGFLTSAIAYILKNINTLVGVIGAVGKLAAGLINIFQPSKDDLVDDINKWTEIAQKGLFKVSEILKKFTG